MQIGFSVSNCYRYLISGSEDRSAYVYDIGTCQLVDKTKNKDHGDGVTDVAVNPKFMEWATSSIDGHARTFRYPALKMGKSRVNRQQPGSGGMQTKEKVNAVRIVEHEQPVAQ